MAAANACQSALVNRYPDRRYPQQRTHSALGESDCEALGLGRAFPTDHCLGQDRHHCVVRYLFIVTGLRQRLQPNTVVNNPASTRAAIP
ncbi:MAG: hypothetical protein CM15mP120_20290 [Pseudomonadota bacterium]|nr:MAG: hypothetical protein CM15mP120_20290 [Pseudomonadota bacterium]